MLFYNDLKLCTYVKKKFSKTLMQFEVITKKSNLQLLDDFFPGYRVIPLRVTEFVFEHVCLAVLR